MKHLLTKNTVYTIQTVLHCLNSLYVCYQRRLGRYWDGLMSFEAKCWTGGQVRGGKPVFNNEYFLPVGGNLESETWEFVF